MTAPIATDPNPSTASLPSTLAVPTGTPSGQAPPSAPPAEYRYTASDVPSGSEFLIGKTAKEAAALAGQMFVQIQQRPFQPAYQPAPQPGYQPYPGVTVTPEPPKQDEWLNNPQEATRKYAEYLQATQFAPQIQGQTAALAQTNRSLIQMQRPDEFKRWGPEIEMELQRQIPDAGRWTPQNLSLIVDIVKARHVNELIAEETSKLRNELGNATVRPGGALNPTGATVSTGIDLEQLPPGYKEALRNLKVDQRVIDEFLHQNYVVPGRQPNLDKARAEWVRLAQTGDVFAETGKAAVYSS